MQTLLPARSLSFDANGNAVVSVTGDEDAADIYVTVGDGSAPSDPTSGANDGHINARSGSVDTGVKITTGREAYVKAVAAASGGTLGPVQAARQARSIGPFHKDATSRSASGGGPTLVTAETITVPANTLGANGALRLVATFQSIGGGGTKEFYITWNGSTVVSHVTPSGFTGASRIEMLLTNDGGTSSQEVAGIYTDETPTVNLTRSTPSVDTTSDVDIEVRIRATSAGDAITLNLSVAELIGTN